MSELSEADLRRVADCISQLMGTPASGGHAAHACTEACGFCQSCAEINPELCRSFISLGAERIMHRGSGESFGLQHTAYRLYSVEPGRSNDKISLRLTAETGVRSAVATCTSSRKCGSKP